MRPGGTDLHVHTTASDGTLSPADTVREAAERGVSLLAITDHDTTDGLAEAQAAAVQIGVALIPGVELSVDLAAYDVHLLGYFIHHDDPDLQEVLRELRAGRNLRNERILERLRSLGAPVEPERVREIAGPGSVGRPHVAAALVEAGHVASRTEAFTRYLARGKPAFVPRMQLTPAEGCAVIRRAGGLAVLAHPAKIGSRTVLDELISAGVDGIEVYHSDHSAADVESLLARAKTGNLLVTGGSDSHGPRSDRPLAVGSLTFPTVAVEQLLARAPEWWKQAHRSE